MADPDTLAAPIAQLDSTVRRVLVVDDSRAQIRLLSVMLNRMGLDVGEAESAEQALTMLPDFKPDLVISDWMMPGMSGPEFCRAFRQITHDRYGYFILLTSKSSKDEIAMGLDAGADDFLTKPVDAGELRARISAGARILAMERELSEKNRLISATLDELQGLYAAIEQDLKQARKIQQALVPRRFRGFDRARVSLLLKPCGHVGGDMVGCFSADDRNLGFYNFDVSGHGVTSALMTARVAGQLSTDYPDQNIALERQDDGVFRLRSPDRVAALLNARLAADAADNAYLTLLYGALDMYTGALRLVQAGHPPPLLLPAEGAPRFVGTGGLPVGLLAEAEYDAIDLVLTPGDRLLVYSDGVTETLLPGGGMLDQDGLLKLVQDIGPSQSGTEFLDDLYWSLCAARDPGHADEDDISAVLLEYLPAVSP